MVRDALTTGCSKVYIIIKYKHILQLQVDYKQVSESWRKANMLHTLLKSKINPAYVI